MFLPCLISENDLKSSTKMAKILVQIVLGIKYLKSQNLQLICLFGERKAGGRRLEEACMRERERGCKSV
jgi:hypothetical protein